MALLTSEERKTLAEKGMYVKEKCDNCLKPILSPVSFTQKDKKVWCAVCAKGQDITAANIKQEDERMAKQKKQASGDSKKEAPEKVSKKVGGFLPNGSSIGDLYLLLEDEKKHSFKEGEAVVKKHKKDLMGRLGNLYRSGIRNKAWSLIVDKEAETIQMKLGKPTGDPMVVKAEKPAKAAKKKDEEDEPAKKPAKKSAPASASSNGDKGLKTVQALVRRTLKGGKDWTKNKLADHLHEEHDIASAITASAIAAEIKAGGVKLEDGVLELV
jgi:hypothetical protein